MRTVWGISFAGLIGAGAVGTYSSAVVAGLVAVLTGQAFAAGSPWPAGVSVLALLGAVGGWLLAGLTRARLVPGLSRRTLVFTLGGLVSFPLAVAVGQLHQLGGVGIVLVVIAGLAGIIRCLSGSAGATPAPTGRPMAAAFITEPLVVDPVVHAAEIARFQAKVVEGPGEYCAIWPATNDLVKTGAKDAGLAAGQ